MFPFGHKCAFRVDQAQSFRRKMRVHPVHYSLFSIVFYSLCSSIVKAKEMKSKNRIKFTQRIWPLFPFCPCDHIPSMGSFYSFGNPNWLYNLLDVKNLIKNAIKWIKQIIWSETRRKASTFLEIELKFVEHCYVSSCWAGIIYYFIE